MQYLILFLIIHVSAFSSQKVLDYIFEKLPEVGILKQDERGFVYVDLDDQYIYKLQAFIEPDGFEYPPYFGDGLHGAHITVISANEASRNNIWIEEIGTPVYFTIKDWAIVHPPSWQGISEVYLVTVHAPILEKIRTKYGLAKPPHAFHITIGVKKYAHTAA